MKNLSGKIYTWFRVRSIRNRILISFVLMSLFTALAVSTGSLVVSYFEIRQQTIVRLESAISLKRIEIENWVDSIQNSLLIVLNDDYNIEQVPVMLSSNYINPYLPWYYKEAIQRRLVAFIGQSTEIQEICLFDLSGQVVLCSEEFNSKSNCNNQEFFQNGIYQPNVEFPFLLGKSDLISNNQDETDCDTLSINNLNRSMIVSRPVVDTNGQVVGVIAASAKLDALSRILGDNTGLGNNGKAYIFKNDTGITSINTTSSSDDLLFISGENLGIFTSELIDIQNNQITFSGNYKDFQGNHVIGVMYWLTELQILLAVEQNLADAFSAIRHNLIVSLGIWIGAAFVAVITSILVTRSITKPVTQLVETASQIAAGDLYKVVDVKGNDEISEMGRKFNSMTAQLRDLINTLEERVSNRTKDLEQANKALELHALKLEASTEVSRRLTSFLDFEDLIQHVVILIGDTFNYEQVRIFLQEKNCLSLRAIYKYPEPDLHVILLEDKTIQTKAANTQAAVIRKRKPQNISLIDQNNLLDSTSELCVPIKTGKKILGVLDIVSKDEDAFSNDDLLLFQSLADQVAVAIENCRLHERNLEFAVLEERSRLARDLHDSVVQYLYSLNLLCSGWRRLLQSGATMDIEENLEKVRQISLQALKEMRLMVYQLVPTNHEWKGLTNALANRLEAVEERTGIRTSLSIPENLNLPIKIEENLYYIAQEALNNAIKHSAANEVNIHLSIVNGYVSLLIKDNGQGFIPYGEVQNSGMGLLSMKSRTDELHGTFEIQSYSGTGTEVSVVIPLLDNQ